MTYVKHNLQYRSFCPTSKKWCHEDWSLGKIELNMIYGQTACTTKPTSIYIIIVFLMKNCWSIRLWNMEVHTFLGGEFYSKNILGQRNCTHDRKKGTFLGQFYRHTLRVNSCGHLFIFFSANRFSGKAVPAITKLETRCIIFFFFFF